MNLPGLTVLCRISSSVFIGPLFFEELVTGFGYLNMLRTLIMPNL